MRWSTCFAAAFALFTAKSAASSEARRLPDHVPHAPQPRYVYRSASGYLSQRAVQRVLREAQPILVSCYRQSIQEGSPFEGFMRVRFIVDRRGHVGAASVEDSTRARDRRLPACVYKALRQLRFPRPLYGVALVQHVVYFRLE